MRLIHYSPEPLQFEHRPYEQDDVESFTLKPRGLWVSADDAWAVAADDMFGNEVVRYASLVTLKPDANILYLKTVGDIDDFTTQYIAVPLRVLPQIIDWRRVAEKYRGILIAPYQFKRRLTPHTFWYYGWDCASGCIWDTAAIASVEAIEHSAIARKTP